MTKLFSFKRAGPMQNPPPTHCLAARSNVNFTDTSRSRALCQSQPQCFLIHWKLFGASFPGPQEEGGSGAPCPSSLFLVPAVSKGLSSPQVHLCFYGGSLEQGQALLPLSSWSWGRELRGLEPFPLSFPLPDVWFQRALNHQ